MVTWGVIKETGLLQAGGEYGAQVRNGGHPWAWRIVKAGTLHWVGQSAGAGRGNESWAKMHKDLSKEDILHS